jgi:uncharacterized membrane protein
MASVNQGPPDGRRVCLSPSLGGVSVSPAPDTEHQSFIIAPRVDGGVGRMLWKFLHIACMFGAVAIVVGSAVIRNAILRGGDVVAIRRVLAAERRLGNLVAGPLFLAGLVFGFVTAVTVGFDLTAPWLVIAYVLVVAIIVHGYLVYDPFIKRVEAAVESSDPDSSAQLQALIRSRRPQLHNGIDVFFFVAIIFSMVVKPFS